MPLSSDLQSGDLTTKTFPRLFWDIASAHATGVLETKKGEVCKKVFFEVGHPVHAESNLLHETLGKFMVERGIITSDQEQAALVQALEAQSPIGDVLLKQGVIDAAALSDAMRKNFVFKILDCFAWDRGSYTFSEDSTAAEQVMKLKMNPARLVLRGVDSTFPIDRISADGFHPAEQTYRVVSKAPFDLSMLQLGADDVQLLQALKLPKTATDVAKEKNLPEETAVRKLYAFFVLGLLSEGEPSKEVSLDELVGATLLQSLKPSEPPPPVDQADAETQALANEIAADYMRLMDLNYFELLGAEETATAVQIRDKFMEFATRYSPSRFKSPALGEFREQGEEIFLKGVKAFSALSDFDSKTKYLDKIKAERKKGEEGKKKKAGEAFKIQTKLLDGGTQFQKGVQFLKKKDFTRAIEHFEYARDIESRNGSYLAHLGWATFQKNPERNRKEAEELLKQARNIKPETADAAFVLGKFYLATERPSEALSHLKRAADLSPKNIEMVRELRNAERKK